MAVSMALVGCQNKQQVGALAGGAIGALAGAQFGRGAGQAFAIAAGAVVGGVIGSEIGKNMDEQDRRNLESAAVNTPMNSEAQWTNNQTGTTYVVRPTGQSRHHGRYCREYQTTVMVGGKEEKAYGKACRQPDGSWELVK